MASRSSGGMGVLVALVVFILLSVALLLTTMLFYTKQQKALRAQQEADAALATYVSAQEKSRDDIRALAEIADRNNQSVVGYLKEEFEGVMNRVGGAKNWTRSDLESQLQAVGLEETEAMLDNIQSLRQEIENLEGEAATLQAQLDEAHELAEQQVEARRLLSEDYEQAKQELKARIDEIQSLADSYRRQVDDAEQQMNERVAEIREDLQQELADANAKSERQQTEIAGLKDAIASLQERVKGVTIGLRSEAELVDGTVTRVLDNNEVFISLGARDHIVLGMTFEVYGSAADVRRDALGNTPRGKATIEVVRINDTLSTARIIRSTQGQAVVEGDILVNAIYDKEKEYSFFVFGDFDLDGENGPSEMETEMIKARIREWGGVIRDNFTGDIDYLVLGVEPQRPLPLRPDATPAEIRRWVRENQFFEQYQEYLERARDLSIPVLNQNRLLTLIGHYRR